MDSSAPAGVCMRSAAAEAADYWHECFQVQEDSFQVEPLYLHTSTVQHLSSKSRQFVIAKAIPILKRARIEHLLLTSGPTRSQCSDMLAVWLERLGDDLRLVDLNLKQFLNMELAKRPNSGLFKGWPVNLIVDYLDATQHLKELKEVSCT